MNQQPPQTRLHFFVSTRVAFLRLCDFCSWTSRRCADGMKYTVQDSVWQSRSVLTRCYAVDLSPRNYRHQSPQRNEQRFPLRFNPCATVFICGSEFELPNTEPHACELGLGKLLNNQTQYPPSSRDADECDWIDTLVTRCISANDSHHPARASEATMSKTPDRVLGVHGFVRPRLESPPWPLVWALTSDCEHLTRQWAEPRTRIR